MTDKTDTLILDSRNIPPEKLKLLNRTRALVLNADYTPISVMPPSVLTWNEAISQVFKGSLEIVEEYKAIKVKSPSVTLHVPCVLVSKTYTKPTHKVHFSKHNLFARDDYRCQYCGVEGTYQSLTLDHLKPRSKGGRTEWTNIVAACVKCNGDKSDRLDYRKPNRMPFQPEHADLTRWARRQPLVIPDPRWAIYLHWLGRLHVHDPFDNTYLVDRNGELLQGEATQDEIGF